jgi:transcriptional regulator with XRE-family HTH domain
LTLRARKPASREKYPDICRTWGDWIKARRLDLRLTKRQLSFNFHVDDTTIYLWEKNRVKPSLAQIPKIIEFLGRDPFETEAENLADKLKNYRRTHGLSQKKFSEMLGFDQTTLAGWERGNHRPSKKSMNKMHLFINSSYSPYVSNDLY